MEVVLVDVEVEEEVEDKEALVSSALLVVEEDDVEDVEVFEEVVDVKLSSWISKDTPKEDVAS